MWQLVVQDLQGGIDLLNPCSVKFIQRDCARGKAAAIMRRDSKMLRIQILPNKIMRPGGACKLVQRELDGGM